MLSLLLVFFTFVELNCENLFDTVHDSLKEDYEFLPASNRHWTVGRYWKKINHIGQAIVSCGDSQAMLLPDLVVLTEVENDSVMVDLTRKSPLRNAHYDYVMTNSPDLRGIDVALLYSPYSFRLISSNSFRVAPVQGHRPTRDILYASGIVSTGDTLHVFGVHAPSRAGGAKSSQSYRMRVAERLCEAVDSVVNASQHPLIIISGDFNDYSVDASLRLLAEHGLTEVSLNAVGHNGAQGTYRYRGEWGSLDHVFCNSSMLALFKGCHINDAPFLLVREKKYGGVQPRRTYIGPRYQGGFSDHLPLVATFDF